MAHGHKTGSIDLGAIYREARLRLEALVRASDPAVEVAACPGWRVHDVVAHLVAVAEDVVAGRLRRPPRDDETAAQVARRAGRPTAEVLGDWEEVAPAFEQLVGRARIWPALVDVVSHEHDVRGALGVPGARQLPAVAECSSWLLEHLEAPGPLVVEMDGVAFSCGPPGPDCLLLSTSAFEVLRFRTGRRSRAQLEAMAWRGDPGPVLDHLAVFGPSPQDIVE